MPITNTWQRRLTGTHSWLRRAGLIVGLTSCSIVAIATIWGWIFNQPIDVSGPARTAVNRTAQQWSVVISVSERPYRSAAPDATFQRLPVLYSRYGVRSTALPARVDGT